MSEKDSVSSQDIPSVIRALGTLALAAATAVAIKWFISRDKAKKAEDKESKFQCNQDPVEEGQSSRDDPKADEEILENNLKDPQVSDEHEMIVLASDCFSHGLMKSSLHTSHPNIVYVKEDGECQTDHKRLLVDLMPVSCKLNYVEGPQKSLHNSEGTNVSISGLPAAIVDDKTNNAQNQVFSSCFTQKYEETSYKMSQEQQLNIRTSSSNGECTDVMNVKCLGYKSQPIGEDNLASGICIKHETVNVCGDEDLFNMDTSEMNGNFNCDSDINNESDTKPCVENNDNMSGLSTGKNTEDNTREHVSKRENPVNICALSLPESQESVNTFIRALSPLSCEVLPRCPKEQPICTQNILQAIDIMQESKETTITVSNEDTVLTNALCKDCSQDEKFNFTHDGHITCIQQSSMEHNSYETSEKILEANENLKCSIMNSILACTPVPEMHMAVEEKNGELFSSVSTLHNQHDGKHDKETLGDEQISGGSHNHMELFGLPEDPAMDERKIKNTISQYTNHVLQWNTRTIYNSTEYIDLVYPLDLHAPENSITPLTEKDEGQSYLEDNVSFSSEKSISVCKEREYNSLDAESTSESSISQPVQSATLNTFSSTMVTKTEIQGMESTRNEQDNDVLYNWHKHDANFLTIDNANFLTIDKNEFCTVITNGYFSRYHKQIDTNRFGCSSEKIKPEECFGKNQQSAIFQPWSKFLQNPVGIPEESSNWSPFSSNDIDTASSVMMDISKSELKCSQQTTQVIKQDPHLSKENMAVGRMEQASNCLWSSAENLGQSNPDITDSRSNDACSEQGCGTSCTLSPSHNEEQYKIIESIDQERLDTVEPDVQSFSRERIMSTIAETPELILPEYKSVFTSKKKKPLMTKSCDNIYSGPSCQKSAKKTKAQSMLCLLTEYYTTKLHSLENCPLEELARGCFIRIPKGFKNMQEGVRFQLTLGNCLEFLKLARKKDVPELLKAVYTLISDNYLHVLRNSSIYGQLTGLERERILQLRMRGQLSLCIIETQSIFGLNKNINCSEDISPDQPKDQIYSLDMESNQWKQVTNIPEEACLKGCSICSMHNYLFIAGGIQKTKNGLLCSNKLFCYNPLTDIWTQLAPMNQARSQLKLVPLDGYLYAIGGECLHTMERYNPRSNKWTFVASLPKGSFAVAHEAAACGGEIYISGGHLFYRLLKYNPVRDQWEECPFNASRGRSCDMVAVGHILYRFDMDRDSTVNIFKYNTTAKVWSEYTTTFPNSKVPFRCAVLGGTIYCLNRETTACFSLEEEQAMFEPAMFSKVPTKGVGYHYPVMLSLQGSLSQTSV